jgi:hypothetical protein
VWAAPSRAGRPDNCSDADYTDLVPVSSATQPAYRTGEYYPPIVVLGTGRLVEVSAPQPVVGGGNPVFARRAPSSAEALNGLSGAVGMLTTPAIVYW